MVRDTGAQPLGQGLEGPATRQDGGAVGAQRRERVWGWRARKGF